MARNPFTPTFGVSPPLLVAREDELAAFAEALDDGPGAPGRAMLFTGARGSGKTVLLNAVEEEARARGWLVISATARTGVAQEITAVQLPALLSEHSPDAVIRRSTGLDATVAGFGGGLTREHIDRFPAAQSLRSELSALTAVLRPHQTGVLITLDEVHTAALEDLRIITHAVQHAFREDSDVAFAAAGLPLAVEDILNDDVMTFLRRAERFSLGGVPRGDVQRALAMPIAAGGREITPAALDLAVEGTRSYPFMVQLVGHQVWNAKRDAHVITEEQANVGVERAAARVGDLVHQPALSSLSLVDRSFLRVMAVDDGVSRMSDIGTRLGVDRNYASQYRLRLLAAGLISEVGRGGVDLTLPYLREYLRNHVSLPANRPDTGLAALQRSIEHEQRQTPPRPPRDAPGSPSR